MKFEFGPKTLPAYIKAVEEEFKDDTALVFSKRQISTDNPKATGIRITIKELIDLWDDRKVQEIIEEIIDKGSYSFTEQDRKDLKIDEYSHPFTEQDKQNFKTRR
jgi:hypothetical protein